MSDKVSQFLLRSLLLVAFAILVSAEARPPQFGENQDIDSQVVNTNDLESGLNNLKEWRLESLLRRLNEYNNAQPNYGSYAGWGRDLRNPEVKRQSRYRQCYFNPISCFRK